MSEASKSHDLFSAGVTDVGLVREANEDSFIILEDEEFFLVADGMGGHQAGERASQIAVEEISTRYMEFMKDDHADLPSDPVERATEAVRCAIELANARIHAEAAADPKLKGMGTTLVSVVGVSDAFVVSHVGDSRAYLIRGGVVSQVTRDHSLLNLYLDQGLIKEEEIENFPQKNIILRAMGREDNAEPDSQVITKVPGDILLLCSDGLSDLVDEKTIAAVVSENIRAGLEPMASALIRHALQAGGKDNVTVILVETGMSNKPAATAFDDDDATVIGSLHAMFTDHTDVGTRPLIDPSDDTVVGQVTVDTDKFPRPRQLDEATTQPIDPAEVSRKVAMQEKAAAEGSDDDTAH